MALTRTRKFTPNFVVDVCFFFLGSAVRTMELATVDVIAPSSTADSEDQTIGSFVLTNTNLSRFLSFLHVLILILVVAALDLTSKQPLARLPSLQRWRLARQEFGSEEEVWTLLHLIPLPLQISIPPATLFFSMPTEPRSLPSKQE